MNLDQRWIESRKIIENLRIKYPCLRIRKSKAITSDTYKVVFLNDDIPIAEAIGTTIGTIRGDLLNNNSPSLLFTWHSAKLNSARSFHTDLSNLSKVFKKLLVSLQADFIYHFDVDGKHAFVAIKKVIYYADASI